MRQPMRSTLWNKQSTASERRSRTSAARYPLTTWGPSKPRYKPSDLLFRSGSLEVNTDQGEFGPKFVEYLKGNDYLVFVTGYTDSQNPIGSLAQRYPTNWELSSARAALAVRYLASEGVADERLWAIGRAANDSVATNDTPEGRAQNRRLRVILRPVELVTNTP